MGEQFLPLTLQFGATTLFFGREEALNFWFPISFSILDTLLWPSYKGLIFSTIDMVKDVFYHFIEMDTSCSSILLALDWKKHFNFYR